MMRYLFFIIFILFLRPSETNSTKVCLNEEEARLYELINDHREDRGLPAIPYSARLTQVAQAHVRDLEQHYTFAHDNQCNPHSWSENGAWTSCCYTNDHKEAACMWNKPREIAGYEGPGFEIAYYSSAGARAKEGLDGWIRSESHYPLIVNSGQWEQIQWKAIGMGIYGKYAVVWFGQEADPSEFSQCR